MIGDEATTRERERIKPMATLAVAELQAYGKPDFPEVEEDIMGWIAACVLIALLLPLMGFLYLDILETKNEAKSQVEKVEKLRRQVEQKEREKEK